MKKAIYKIENKINHKIYIGQAINPIERFKNHCYPSSLKRTNSLIDKAIQKYGKENFDLEIMGWFENYNEKEKYYIKLYRCLTPNGYNILKGGNEPPLFKGELHPNARITDSIAEKIKNDL